MPEDSTKFVAETLPENQSRHQVRFRLIIRSDLLSGNEADGETPDSSLSQIQKNHKDDSNIRRFQTLFSQLGTKIFGKSPGHCMAPGLNQEDGEPAAQLPLIKKEG
ncbi:hypothetical protein JTB14_013364 [Gonioctena quinquepunctata]|nr:hypothetical protein JTB14_013364 [Gonioctena quinquepunctata]